MMGCTGILYRHAANQTVGNVHGDGAHHIVTQMLGHFDDQVVLIVVDGGLEIKKRGKNRRQLCPVRTQRRRQAPRPALFFQCSQPSTILL
jgi:hypothetical protein